MVNIDFIGRLGSDAELKSSQKGTQYLKFSVATDEFVNNKNETSWLSVIAPGDNAVKKAEYLKKGTLVSVRGVETIRQYTNKLGEVGFSRDVMADRVDFVSVGKKDETKEGGSTATTTARKEETPFGNSGTFVQQTPQPAPAVSTSTTTFAPVDDDLPF